MFGKDGVSHEQVQGGHRDINVGCNYCVQECEAMESSLCVVSQIVLPPCQQHVACMTKGLTIGRMGGHARVATGELLVPVVTYWLLGGLPTSYPCVSRVEKKTKKVDV